MIFAQPTNNTSKLTSLLKFVGKLFTHFTLKCAKLNKK